jgi:HEAT repeat protein
MKRIIELKHVGAKRHVWTLLEELVDRVEEKVSHFPPDAVSIHVLFEENGTHKLYRTSLSCHLPGRTVAAREERREAGESIRKAFAEITRQLEKEKAAVRHERQVRRDRRTRRMLALGLLAAALAGPPAWASERADEAAALTESGDPYQRQLGFLRLEALREPGTTALIRHHLASRDPALRAYAVRAFAAIDGAAAVPMLLQALRTDRDPEVRRAALLGLEPLQPSRTDILPAFIKALRDKKTEVRMTAVDIVSRINDPQAKDAIRARAKRERNRNVRRALIAALRRLEGP